MASNGGRSTNIVVIKALHIPGDSGNQGIFDSNDASNKISFSCDLISMTDSYNPKFAEEAAYGKMDPMVFFQNTTRKMSIKITTLANEDDKSAYSALKLTKKVQKLQAFQYPRYAQGGGGDDPNGITTAAIAAPPLFEVMFFKEGLGINAGKKYTVYKSFKGYMSSVSIEPGSQAISVGDGNLDPQVSEIDSQKYLLERGWVIEFELGILHDKPPGWQGNTWAGPNLYTVGFDGNAGGGKKITGDPNTTLNQWSNQNTKD
tara:strand:+ start:12778 stop:13557 length:780 start_codon:yes stop_codon:yes gene_type:complete